MVRGREYHFTRSLARKISLNAHSNTKLEQHDRYVPGLLMASAIRMLRNSVKTRVPGFDIYDLKPIANVDKAFIPALFVHGKQDDFIPSHSEKLHKKYAGEANIMLVEGDHNSRRPRYARDSAAIFLKTALRVPDSYAIPVHGYHDERGRS